MSPLLQYTEDLYILLAKVERLIVLFHDSCECHSCGFSWDGSDMSVPAQEAMCDFQRAGLFDVGPHRPWGARVSLSDTGTDRLAEWRKQHLAGLRNLDLSGATS